MFSPRQALGILLLFLVFLFRAVSSHGFTSLLARFCPPVPLTLCVFHSCFHAGFHSCFHSRLFPLLFPLLFPSCFHSDFHSCFHSCFHLVPLLFPPLVSTLVFALFFLILFPLLFSTLVSTACSLTEMHARASGSLDINFVLLRAGEILRHTYHPELSRFYCS